MFTFRVTDDIELRLMAEEDALAVYKLVEANRVFLVHQMRWADKMRTVTDVRQFIQHMRQEYANNDAVPAHIWYQECLAGSVTLTIRSRAHGEAELGYWLGAAYTGRGIVTRSVHALAGYAFRGMNLYRLYIRCGADNPKSCAVAERLGFVREGIMRQAYHHIDGRISDLYLYSLLVDEWRETV